MQRPVRQLQPAMLRRFPLHCGALLRRGIVPLMRQLRRGVLHDRRAMQFRSPAHSMRHLDFPVPALRCESGRHLLRIRAPLLGREHHLRLAHQPSYVRRVRRGRATVLRHGVLGQQLFLPVRALRPVRAGKSGMLPDCRAQQLQHHQRIPPAHLLAGRHLPFHPIGLRRRGRILLQRDNVQRRAFLQHKRHRPGVLRMRH